MRQFIPQTLPDYDLMRITERPNGFYWRAKGGNREYGPFATLVDTVFDAHSAEGPGPGPGETLEEVESEIGIAAFIDSETGEPVEEERPCLEQH